MSGLIKATTRISSVIYLVAGRGRPEPWVRCGPLTTLFLEANSEKPFYKINDINFYIQIMGKVLL